MHTLIVRFLTVALATGLGGLAAGCIADAEDVEDAEVSVPGPEDTYEAQLQNNGGGTPGGTCHVTGGPNKGKTGTYDSEGACCDEGPNGWGCTECHGSNQGKCADGPAPKIKVRPVITTGGGVFAP